MRPLLWLVFSVALLVTIAASPPDEFYRAHTSRGEHCGCPAAKHECSIPCSACCAPGPCPMTGPTSCCAPVTSSR